MVSSAQKKRDRKAAQVFKLVASSTRVSILALLSRRKVLAVQDIAKELRMTHSAVSHQLSRLAAADIVVSEKDGRSVRYMLSKSSQAKALIRFLTAVS